MKNRMTIEVLDDGSFKIETGDMGGVSHHSVGEFLKDMEREAGGVVKKEKLKKKHTHTHNHLNVRS